MNSMGAIMGLRHRDSLAHLKCCAEVRAYSNRNDQLLIQNCLEASGEDRFWGVPILPKRVGRYVRELRG